MVGAAVGPADLPRTVLAIKEGETSVILVEPVTVVIMVGVGRELGRN